MESSEEHEELFHKENENNAGGFVRKWIGQLTAPGFPWRHAR